jgi:hypothetical protein
MGGEDGRRRWEEKMGGEDGRRRWKRRGEERGEKREREEGEGEGERGERREEGERRGRRRGRERREEREERRRGNKYYVNNNKFVLGNVVFQLNKFVPYTPKKERVEAVPRRCALVEVWKNAPLLRCLTGEIEK